MAANRPQQIKVTFIDPSLAPPDAFRAHIGRRGRLAAWGLLLSFIALAVYAPALLGKFSYFDDQTVTNNPALRSWWDGLRAIWIHPTVTPHFQPLAYSVLLVEFKLFSTKMPGGYLAINVLLHATNVLLLWTLLRKLEIPGALVAAILFAVHPINVEAVAWISQQPLLLAAAFYLSAMLVYLRYCGINPAPQDEVPSTFQLPRRPALLYLLAAALLLAAMMCHSVAVSFPLAALVIIWWERGRVLRRDLGALVPLLAMSAIWLTIELYAEARRGAAMNDLIQLGAQTRVLVAARAVWIYLWHLIFPMRLSFAYPKWTVGLIDIVALAAIGIVIISTWLGRSKIGRGPFAGSVLFLLAILPVFALRHDLSSYAYVADHLLYLAAMLPITAIASTIAQVIRERCSAAAAWLAATLGGAVVIVLAIMTQMRLPDYRTAESVWSAALRRDPSSVIANNSLGLIQLNEHANGAAAMEYFHAALRTDPGDSQTHMHVAGAYEFLKDFGKARDEYLQVLAQAPNDVEAHSGLAHSLAALGYSEAAIGEYELVLTQRPNDVIALNNIGVLHDERGEYQQAQAAYERAIKANPGYTPTYSNLGNLQYRLGQIEPAIQTLVRLLQVDPTSYEAYNNGGAWAAELAKREDLKIDQRLSLNDQAQQLLVAAIRLKPSSAVAYANLGSVLVQKSQLTGHNHYDAAVFYLQRAVELDPDNQNAWQTLGRAKAAQAKTSEKEGAK